MIDFAEATECAGFGAYPRLCAAQISRGDIQRMKPALRSLAQGTIYKLEAILMARLECAGIQDVDGRDYVENTLFV